MLVSEVQSRTKPRGRFEIKLPHSGLEFEAVTFASVNSSTSRKCKSTKYFAFSEDMEL